jgi:hypothetical protein
MKNDTYQTNIESTQNTQNEDWYDWFPTWVDSNQVREFDETIQTYMIRFTTESIQYSMRRFTWSQRAICCVPRTCELIQP